MTPTTARRPADARPAPPAGDPTPPGDAATANLDVIALTLAGAVFFHQAKGGRLVDVRPHDLALTLAAVWTMLRPSSAARLFVLAAVQVACVAIDLPWVTNHWIFLTLVNLTLLLCLLSAWRPGGSGAGLVRGALGAAVPAVRVEVVLLYFFVTLAKLNPAFFDPRLSAAGEMYRWLALKLHAPIDGDAARVAIAVLTVVIEGAIPLLLIVRRTRDFGILFALAFHLILGVNGYYDFSAAALALYAFFLPADLPERLGRVGERLPRLSRSGRALGRLASHPAAFPVLAAGVVGLAVAGRYVPGLKRPAYLAFNLAWLVYYVGLGLLYALAWRLGEGRPDHRPIRYRPLRNPLVLAGPLLVLLNGLCPYLGLKTGNSFAMFSNLQTEGDQWNHLVLPRAMRVFPYQDELVTIVESSDPYLQRLQRERTRLVYPHLRLHLDGHPEASLTYERGGRRYVVPRVGDDPELSRRPPYWLRKLFLFRAVPPPERNALQH